MWVCTKSNYPQSFRNLMLFWVHDWFNWAGSRSKIWRWKSVHPRFIICQVKWEFLMRVRSQRWSFLKFQTNVLLGRVKLYPFTSFYTLFQRWKCIEYQYRREATPHSKDDQTDFTLRLSGGTWTLEGRA